MSELEIGVVVTHNPSGHQKLKDLVDQKVFPGNVLEPDFRIVLIVGYKGDKELGGHWLIYRGDEKVPVWYIGDELKRLS